ncbi:hypothetical protein HH214_00955 [Mucilaginibacter robiniae]|uniref:Uncharacterized protein n=1 Tax=Mucilaginibacter robiniae TaxID=2728022 RepID=A0A7L5DTW3_9SPHI|nr:hypothetical protein [Mucilaginibacter robiniae]QJD94540.1 hypothetical protein HH214_00955 [Mucilaginibacter robiniae]
MPTENQPASTLYVVTIQQLQTQDMAIGGRLLWLINAQAFLFGIYSASVVFMAPTPDMKTLQRELGMAMPLIGLSIAVFTLLDIISSIAQMNRLTKNYRQSNNGHDQEFEFPLVSGTYYDRLLRRVSPIISTLIFISVWSYLIMYDHHWL